MLTLLLSTSLGLLRGDQDGSIAFQFYVKVTCFARQQPLSAQLSML